MNRQSLVQQIIEKKSFLCVGLDTDLNKIPQHLLEFEDPIFEFNKQIIEATQDLCVAYKPNIAFYEQYGPDGWNSLKKTIDVIPANIFTIADAKRGDIGNTSSYYAKTFFEYLGCDSVTVAPYMGSDSVTPFLQHENKWVILLALTSNAGALDFQTQKLEDGEQVFEKVLRTSQEWGTPDNLMYVVGATRAELIGEVRRNVPNHFFLVPGVGAQGGSLEEVAKHGVSQDRGVLVNSYRGIMYASQGKDLAEKARAEALKIQQQMSLLMEKYQVAIK